MSTTYLPNYNTSLFYWDRGNPDFVVVFVTTTYREKVKRTKAKGKITTHLADKRGFVFTTKALRK